MSTDGFGRGLSVPLASAVELHEDEVPDFDVAAAVAGEFAIAFAAAGLRGSSTARAHVVENFAARAARTGIAHLPEIFLEAGNFDDAIFRRAGLDPERRGVVIGRKFLSAELSAAENGEIELIEQEAQTIRAR